MDLRERIQESVSAMNAPYKGDGKRPRIRLRLSPATEAALWRDYPDLYTPESFAGVPYSVDPLVKSPGWSVEATYP